MRRRDAGELLRAVQRARRDSHGARRERGAGVSAAEGDVRARVHGAGGSPAEPPARGGGRGGQLGHSHRRGPRRAPLPGPYEL